jgi:hypothetical protein
MTSCLFSITAGVWWTAVIITSINVFLGIGIGVSFVLYRFKKQTKTEFYESTVLIAPIILVEILGSDKL